MIVVIDNYDSFTYNLVQYIQEMSQEVQVFRGINSYVMALGVFIKAMWL